MSNLFRVLKRIGCVLLASLMLITSVSISFDVPKVEAVAPTSYAFFYTFVQYMMAQSGLSMRSTSDNESLAREFSYWMEKQQLETEAQLEFAKAKAITKGEKFFITSYSHLITYWNKFANRYVNSNSLATYSDGISASDLYDSFLSNITDYSKSNFESNFSSSYRANYVSYATFFFNGSYYLNLYVKSCYPIVSDSVLLDNSDSELGYSFVKPSPSLSSAGSNGNVFYFKKDNAFKKYSYFNKLGAFSSFSDADLVFYYDSNSRPYKEDYINKVSNFKYITLLDSAIHFSDYADIETMANTSALPKAYGDSSKSSAIPETSVVAGSEDIVRAIQDALSKTDNPTTEDINKIVSDSIASVTGSLSDINDSVDENGNIITNQTNVLTDILTQIRDIKSILQSRTETDGSSALAPDLDDVSEQFKVIQGGGNQSDPDNEDPKIWAPLPFTSVGFLKPLIEYFSEPLSQITKFLKKIKDACEASKNLLDTIKTHQADILQEIKDWEDSAQKDFNAIPSKIWQSFKDAFSEDGVFKFPVEVPALDDLPKIFADYLTEHPLTFPVELPSWDAVKETILNIPQEIKNLGIAFKESIEGLNIEFPSSFPIEFPENFGVNVLNQPLTLLESMKALLSDIADSLAKTFVPDFDVLSEAGQSCTDRLNNHFGISRFQTIFGGLSLKPKNEYPVIKITTPSIIRSVYDVDELVLFNGEDFKDYFSFFRGILNAMIIITYFYCVLRKFKVSFSM